MIRAYYKILTMIKNSALIITLCVILLSCNDSQKQSINQLKIGKEQYYNSKFDSSLNYLNQAINIDSENAEAFYYLGKVNYRINNYNDGLRYLGLAEQKSYNSDSIEVLKLQLLWKMQKYEDYINL